MPNYPVPRPSFQPETLPRGLARQVDAAHARGVVAAARVQAAGFVAHTSLVLTALLTEEESRLIQQTPLGEPRYRAIVDHFTGVACAEIAGMAW